MGQEVAAQSMRALVGNDQSCAQDLVRLEILHLIFFRNSCFRSIQVLDELRALLRRDDDINYMYIVCFVSCFSFRSNNESEPLHWKHVQTVVGVVIGRIL